MFSSTLTLKQFVKEAPQCKIDASLLTTLSIFNASREETLLVSDEQENLLGAVSLSSLVHFFFQHFVDHNSNQDSLSQVRESSLLNDFELSFFLEPIIIVKTQTTVEEFFTYLSQQESSKLKQHYALVNEWGQFLGFLDCWLLLKSFLSISVNERESGDVCEAAPPKGPVAPSGSGLTTSTLMQNVLEQLPLPLMLESADGKVLTSNHTWRSQIGSLTPSLPTKNMAGPTVIKVAPLNEKQVVVGSAVNHWCNLVPDSENFPAGSTSQIQDKQGKRYEVNGERASSETWETFTTQVQSNKSIPQGAWQFVRLPFYMAGSVSEESFFSNSLTPSERSQTTPMWLVVATDVSEQQQLCKELAAKNADLIQLNRLKDEFLACISHELKSPLTAVVGLSSLLKEQRLGQLNERQARYAGLVYESGRHLMILVNDILDLTRLETGQLKLNLSSVSIENICQRAYQQALSQSHSACGERSRTTAEEKEDSREEQPNFSLQIESGIEKIIADELRLRQMLVHLLDNALKFTQERGEIGLKVSRWDGWIAFTVWDTGIGIPPDSQHLIFQKFQQLENPLTRQFEGTGLGLVLSQRLARAHGGDITFISRVGEGSQFTLLLPPRPPFYGQQQGEKDEPQLPPPQEFSLKNGNRLVLIVEVVPQYIEGLAGNLKELGYRVAIARSGTEALEKARQLQPRAILLNPLLPLLSGWDVLTLLKADEKTREIPVLITATGAEKKQAAQNGADGFLILPVEKGALNESLKGLGDQPPARNKALTILRLNPHENQEAQLNSLIGFEFEKALGDYALSLNYRLLEADDLEQAEILARVWRPDVLLLDSLGLEKPLTYLRRLSSYTDLASLPLVTLDAQNTEAANQVKGLSVFPCLVTPRRRNIPALLQVMEVAAGLNSQPNVLVFGDCLRGDNESGDFPESSSKGDGEWLQALVHYLQKAGLKTSLSLSWQEVESQVRHQSLDLLVLYLGGSATPLTTGGLKSQLLEEVKSLRQMEVRPLVLVLDRRSPAPENGKAKSSSELEMLLEDIATKIIRCPSQSMADLLVQINEVING